MANRIINDVAFDTVHQKLEDPRLTPLLLECIHKYNQQFFPEWYTSIFFQIEGPKSPFAIYDAYGLLCLHTELGLGNIVYAEIELGEVPGSDKHHKEMNEKLQRLWPPFRGEFWGGTQNEDGAIYVDEPIELSVITYTGNKKSSCVSGRFPLEVGTTSVFKTMAYLNSGLKRLARWPYASDKLFLLSRQ